LKQMNITKTPQICECILLDRQIITQAQ